MGYKAYNWTHNSESVKSGISTSSTDVHDTGSHGIQKFPTPKGIKPQIWSRATPQTDFPTVFR